MEEFFIPINTHDSKYRGCQRTKSKSIDEGSTLYGVLEAFKLVPNRNRILRDETGRKYQLLTMEQGGCLHTFQRFVVDYKHRVYRLGTKEPHYRLALCGKRSTMFVPFPIAEHVAISAIVKYNPF